MKTQTGSWMRRIIPAGYAIGTLDLVGASPLLMNSPDDPDTDLARAYQALAHKAKKSEDDNARLRELEWQLRIYLDADIGPYIPGVNIKKLISTAATKWSKGATVERSLVVVPYRVPLLYEGPRDQQGLWDGGFRYTTLVKNNGFNAGRVQRCRPMFEEWRISTEVAWDPEEIDLDILELAIKRAERYGLGDYRPEFGAFEATFVTTAVHKAAAQGDATKARNGVREKAHEAFNARIMVAAE